MSKTSTARPSLPGRTLTPVAFSVSLLLSLLACSGDQKEQTKDEPKTRPVAAETSVSPAKTSPQEKAAKAPKRFAEFSPSDITDWVDDYYDQDRYPELVDQVETEMTAFADDVYAPNSLVESIETPLTERVAIMHDIHQAEQAYAQHNNVAPLRIRTATFNTGLLCYLRGAIGVFACRMRQGLIESELARYLVNPDAADVLFLQELWHNEDFVSAMQAARQSGYVPMFLEEPTRFAPGRGLQILVRQDLIDASVETKADFIKFSSALWDKATGVKRGLAFVRVVLREGPTIVFGNTHFTPDLPLSDFYIRDAQRRDLTDAMADLSSQTDYFILGGDFNFSADFSAQRIPHIIDTQLGARTYYRFLEQNQHFDVIDSYRVAHPLEAGYSFDPKLNDVASRFLLESPRRRLDMIWLGRTHRKVGMVVERSGLIFTDPVQDSTGDILVKRRKRIFLSDHFGVQSDFLLFPKP